MQAARLICPACVDRSSEILGERDGYDVFRCVTPHCRYTWRTPVLGHVKMSETLPPEGEKYVGGAYHDTCWIGRHGFAKQFENDYEVGKLRLQTIKALIPYSTPPTSLRLLDVGCSNGAFVLAALREGFDAYGVDLDRSLMDEAASAHPSLGDRLSAMNMHDVRPVGWNVITFHDVLEHLPAPYAELRIAARLIPAGGLVVVEAPNPCDPEMVEAGLRGKHVKPIEHTMLLSPKTWSDMLRSAGFSVLLTTEPVPQKLAIYAQRE